MRKIIIMLLGIGIWFNGHSQVSNIDAKKKYSEIVKELEEYFDGQVQKFGEQVLEGEGSEYSDFQRWKKFWQPRIAQHDGTMIEYMNDLNAAKISKPMLRSFGNVDTWHEVGPYVQPSPGVSTIGGGELGVGIAHDMVFHLMDANKMLAWSLAGGLFYSSNKGVNWVNAGSDNWKSSGCSSAAFAPNNTSVWYGCSNIGGSYYNNIIGSLGGIYRTDDAGATWNMICDRTSFTNLNPVNNEDVQINKILIDPTNPTIAYIATNKGVYKNTMANSASYTAVIANWTLEPITSITDYVDDMEFRTNGSGDLIITKKDASGNWSVAYKSGITWTTLSAYPVASGSYPTFRLAIEVSDNDPNTVFLVNKTTDSYWSSINTQLSSYSFTSSSWTYRSSMANQTGGIGFCVSNFNSNNMYLAVGTGFYKSTNGGYTWPTGISHNGSTIKIHADVDKITTPPAACVACSTEVFMGTHGGISYSNDDCATISTRSSGLGLANGPMATSATNPEKIVMGLDHDGSVLSGGSWTSTWTPSWQTVNDGDGQFPALDYSDPNYVWTSWQNTGGTYAPYVLSSTGGAAYTYTSGLNFPANNNFGQYLVQNKVYPNIVYYPGNNNVGGTYENVWRSNGRGASGPVEMISDFANINLVSLGGGWPDAATHNYWIFNSIFPASDPNIMYVAIGINASPWYGKAYRNNNVLNSSYTAVQNSWVELTLPAGMSNPGLMAVDATNPNIVYYAYRGFSWANPEIWRADYTNITTPVFTNIAGLQTTGGLPGVSIQSLITEKGSNGGIYVGTDIGIFYTNNDMIDWTGSNSQWVELGTNLPNVPMQNMEINYVVNKLRVATSGRGVWENDLYCPAYQSIGLAGPQTVNTYNEAVDQVVSSMQIASNVNVTHRGGTYVDLTIGIGSNPGFSAAPSSTNYFEAYIHPCSHQYYNSPGIKEADQMALVEISEEDEFNEEKQKEETGEIRVYPNPNSGELFINVNEPGMRFELYSILGSKLGDYKLNAGQNKIDLVSVSQGQYIIKIFDADNKPEKIEKIIRTK